MEHLIFVVILLALSIITGVTSEPIRGGGIDVVTRGTWGLGSFFVAAIVGGGLLQWAGLSLQARDACAPSGFLQTMSAFLWSAPLYLGLLGLGALLAHIGCIRRYRKFDEVLSSVATPPEAALKAVRESDRDVDRMEYASLFICGAAFQVIPLGFIGLVMLWFANSAC